MKNRAASMSTVVWWAITCAWAVQIFWFSTGTFTPRFTAVLLGHILRFLHISVSPVTFSLLHAVSRKLAHIVEYGLFALLLYGPPGQAGRRYWRPRRAIVCILAAAAYSLTDEFHQLFVPGRHASIIDCGLDTTGAALAMLLPYTRDRLCFWRQTSLGKKQGTAPAASS
jgi:VanZ family protein